MAVSMAGNLCGCKCLWLAGAAGDSHCGWVTVTAAGSVCGWPSLPMLMLVIGALRFWQTLRLVASVGGSVRQRLLANSTSDSIHGSPERPQPTGSA